MSLELKLEKTCDHIIVREQLLIESDLRTIKIPREIASFDVKLWVNDFVIPKTHEKFGWSLQEDETAITTRYKLLFNKARKSTDDFYHITYNTQPQVCTKCKALRVLNDISYTKLGKVQLVANETKLIQEIRKV